MRRKNNKALTGVGRALRANMTREERHLWYDFLKDYPVQFLRQKILGDYIVDFYCARAKLVIELDGSQHYEPKGLAQDIAHSKHGNRPKFSRRLRLYRQNGSAGAFIESGCGAMTTVGEGKRFCEEMPR